MSDRLRKFFRIRGPTKFQLDEMVAPVVLVQDLTKGPYQAGVTPAAGTISANFEVGGGSTVVLMLNDKAGSITPILDRQFDGRSYSVTWYEMQAAVVAINETLEDLQLFVTTRARVVSAGVPNSAASFFSIQENDGTRTVPVEFFSFESAVLQPLTGRIWRGLIGDNTNTLGARRTIEPQPNITIGPNDAIVLFSNVDPTTSTQVLRISARGFYQEQPS